MLTHLLRVFGIVRGMFTRHLPRTVFGSIAAAFTILFSMLIEPNGPTGFAAAMVAVGCGVPILTGFVWKRPFQALRGTALPYLIKLGCGSTIAMLGLSTFISKSMPDSLLGIPAILTGASIMLVSTMYTKALERK